MISIRESTFETNSSSMHTLTVAGALSDDQLYKNYLLEELKRWETKDGYNIEIRCEEDAVDICDFAMREYVPHLSVNDKLIYGLATIIQHYQKLMMFPPYKVTWRPVSEEEEQQYQKDFTEWQQKYESRNAEVLKKFEESIRNFQDSIVYYMASKLGIDEKLVKLQFKYSVENNVVYYHPEGEYFSTGCYGNEELFLVFDNSWLGFAEWVCNPYSAILAGSDEQDYWETMLQEKKAHELITEAEKHIREKPDIQERIEDLEAERVDENVEYVDALIADLKAGKDFYLPQSRVIYPLGG